MPFVLCVAWVLDLDPSSGGVVSALFVFPDDSFKILLADHPEEVDAKLADVVRIRLLITAAIKMLG